MKIIVREAVAETTNMSFQGNSYQVTSQKAIYESDDGETRAPITLRLKKDSKAYPAGEYRLDDSSVIYDGKKKELSLARELVLVPLRVAGAIPVSGQQRVAS